MKASYLRMPGRVLPWLAAVMLVVVGCKKDEARQAATSTSGPGPGGGGGTGGSGGAGGSGGSGGGVIIEDTPCEDAATAAVEVYPAPTNLQLSQLASAGNRWVASGNLGYVYFDQDGANADLLPTKMGPTFNVLGDEGDTVGLAEGGPNSVGYRRLGEAGEVTGYRGLDTVEPDGVTSAPAAGDTVVVWGRSGKLEARVVDASGGLPGDAYDVKLGAYTTALYLSSAGRGDVMGLAWYGAENASVFQSWFVELDANGTVSEPVKFKETVLQHDLNQLVATDEGYAALVTNSDLTPQIIRLDAEGNVLGEVGGLAGVAMAYGIASQGDAIVVTTRRETGEPQLRVFDLALEPLGPWVCLADAHAESVPVAVAPDGDGYAVIFETEGGAVMLSRVDGVGTGAP